MTNQSIKLGDRIADKVTGFEGIAVCESRFLNGCHRMSIAPRVKAEGDYVEERWFDIEQLELIEAGVVPAKTRVVDVKGAYDDPPDRSRAAK